ncbi:sugar ABC transporter permease [Verminephrobacter aporrectodeae subsp. tuberculatae]|uniref:carbohydrate ABC transporter permease n=1 Tax=Verminephrobacter aporrectodeae TaxID=1110389 RepID=UPI002237498C|nr:sugar ABC transporter permease [Verminephrobacter aporrectodeae]MCW5221472.1 sugar ABC transporter permease [Verminephrobacter aporrectodeae subsp. tuberculatae]MCW5290763.1 sugar ABC transporter permease [Verminephrobacter aporrectodeae subsp. tuberculatae]MCW8198735.1 sugar ABC transporter permease [Verminephrobacter aporrectodeae subsp. tuberculatae]
MSTQSRWFEQHMSQLALGPSLLLITIGVYGFIAFTTVLSFTGSKMLPKLSSFVGFLQYERLWANPRWLVAVENFFVFSILYVALTTVLGLGLAILLDQRVRAEGFLRSIYLYPMSISFIVTGVAWQWLMSPELGLERALRTWGWEGFRFNWIKDERMAIYCVVIAGVWQASGFVMALFLAALRGINAEIISAARIDGAGGLQIHRHVIIPALRPALLTAFVVQAHLAIKSYDLVIALTRGGPGYATELPSTFMYGFTFSRNEMALGSASAVVMLCTLAAIVVPYLVSELKHEPRH